MCTAAHIGFSGREVLHPNTNYTDINPSDPDLSCFRCQQPQIKANRGQLPTTRLATIVSAALTADITDLYSSRLQQPVLEVIASYCPRTHTLPPSRMYYTQQRSSITHYYGTIIIGGNRTTCQLMQGNCAVTRSTAPTLLRGDDDDYNAMRIDCAHTVTHAYTQLYTHRQATIHERG